MAAVTAAVATTAVGIGAGAAQASSQRSSARRAARTEQHHAALQEQHIQAAMQLQMDQVGQQFALDKLQMQNEAAQIRGRLRVAAADGGGGMGGSFLALERQAEYDQHLNAPIMEQNFQNAVLRIESDADAANLNLAQNLASNINAINATRSNPILAGFMGGVQGLSTGLSIANATQQLGDR